MPSLTVHSISDKYSTSLLHQLQVHMNDKCRISNLQYIYIYIYICINNNSRLPKKKATDMAENFAFSHELFIFLQHWIKVLY